MTIQLNIGTDWDNETPGWTKKMGEGLPSNFLEGDETTVLATIAMLCMTPRVPEVMRNPHPQMMATLALYAMGVPVTLTKAQFRKLERAAEQYINATGGERFMNTKNWDFADYVERRAVKRAQRDGVIGKAEPATGLVAVDWENSAPGWTPITDQLPADFLTNPVSEMVLATIAMLSIQPLVSEVAPHPQAFTIMALYAMNGHVTLSPTQFEDLLTTVKQYENILGTDGRFTGARNQELVSYVLDKALYRAVREKVYEG